MRKLLLFAVALAVLAIAPPAMADPKPDHFTFETLSSRADTVSGGDALVAVNVPSALKLKQVKILLGDTDVTSEFSSDPDDSHRLVALLDGLALGENTLVANANGDGNGRAHDELALVNHAITGPVFSGPHQSPFICRTAETANGLGAPLDADCSAPTRVDWFYRSNVTNTFKPLADPTDRPADLAQTTTRDGETVDYVVRMESGTINRAVYRWAVLAAGGETGNGWNRRLVYEYGGGCGPGYHQGTLAQGGVLDNAVLSQGFAKASASLTEFATACNDVLSAETTSMVKERVIEELGEPPVWTMGWGGSGGAIQQNMIAQNYPGLLDGIVPALTFQDAQLGEPVDCRLLNRYFTSVGAALNAAQRRAINGYISPSTCPAWDAAFANVVVASLGCSPIVPTTIRYNAATNPTGARCTTWDSMVNVYGRDPATGFARRTLDNVGVQYGLKALQEGSITVDRFLDLNEKIGGYDNDGNVRAARAVADPEALATAFRTGRVNQAAGGLPDVPILDLRAYSDNLPDIHTYIHSFIMRERLRQVLGSADNQVMWRAAGGGTAPMTAAARSLMADWLDAIEADDSDRPLSEKVVAAKPATGVDACWTGAGVRIDDPAEVNGTGPCTVLYPPASTPRLQAGAPLDSMALKCQLRPVVLSDYPALTPTQEAKLHAVFPDGVCDYTQPGVGQQPVQGTWLSFGS
jgi:hypothetical protein